MINLPLGITLRGIQILSPECEPYRRLLRVLLADACHCRDGASGLQIYINHTLLSVFQEGTDQRDGGLLVEIHHPLDG